MSQDSLLIETSEDFLKILFDGNGHRSISLLLFIHIWPVFCMLSCLIFLIIIKLHLLYFYKRTFRFFLPLFALLLKILYFVSCDLEGNFEPLALLLRQSQEAIR